MVAYPTAKRSLQGPHPLVPARAPTPPSLAAAKPATRLPHATSTRSPPRATLFSWVRAHQVTTAFVAGLVIFGAVAAAIVTIRQNVATTPTTKAPDITFLSGTDYSAMNALGFVTATLGSTGTSATISTIKGIAGAAAVDLTNVLRIQNSASTTDYAGTTLSTDVALNAAITHFYVTVKHGATTDLSSWDAKSGVASSTFTLTHGVTYDVSVQLVIADGTATGANLGSFNLELNLAP